MLDYFNLQPKAFSIDVSDFSLKIMKLGKENGFFKLFSFGEFPLKPGIIDKGEIKDKTALAKSISQAAREVKGEKLGTKYVVASLPEEKAFLQVIQMPLMKKKEVEKAVYFEAENYIPMPMEKVYFDCQAIPSFNPSPDHLEVLIAALPKKTVDAYLEVFQKSELKPLSFEIESQAVARALVENETSQEPLLLVDLGASRTGLALFSGQSLRFTSSVSVSGRQFTRAIAEKMKIGEKEAESVKIEHGIGKTKEGRSNFEALKPFLNSLKDEIEKCIDYHKTHSENFPSDSKEIKKILFCGGGANLKGLEEYFSFELKLSAELGNPWVNILPKPLKEVPELSYRESLKYATALGLALGNQKI